jgi:hypothetical protein
MKNFNNSNSVQKKNFSQFGTLNERRKCTLLKGDQYETKNYFTHYLDFICANGQFCP